MVIRPQTFYTIIFQLCLIEEHNLLDVSGSIFVSGTLTCGSIATTGSTGGLSLTLLRSLQTPLIVVKQYNFNVFQT